MISEMQTLENNLIASSSSTTDEQFHCDGIDDAALQTLLEESTGEIVGENPPSSVVRAFDIESRSAEDYDPDLQFSSPQASDSSGTIGSCASIQSTDTVDWEDIRQQASRSQQAAVVLLTLSRHLTPGLLQSLARVSPRNHPVSCHRPHGLLSQSICACSIHPVHVFVLLRSQSPRQL